jgi:hypothetical protein
MAWQIFPSTIFLLNYLGTGFCSRLIVHKIMGSIPIGAGLMVELLVFFLIHFNGPITLPISNMSRLCAGNRLDPAFAMSHPR